MGRRSMAQYDKIAKQYSKAVGEEGDYAHQTQIDPYIYSIIGNPDGKIIYDIGCGNGYMARNLVKKGATVFASDISKKIIKEAKARSEGFNIHYAVHDVTDFALYRSGQFDVVVMNMVIHYIENLKKLFLGISKILKKDGLFVFSTHHFLRPPDPYSGWIKGKINGKEKLFIKVNGYLETGERKVDSFCAGVSKLVIYNHPLSELINLVVEQRLFPFRVEEPSAAGHARSLKRFSKKLQWSHHIPTFLIIGVRKF